MTWDLSRMYRDFDSLEFKTDAEAAANAAASANCLVNDLCAGQDAKAAFDRLNEAALLYSKVSDYVSLTLLIDAGNTEAGRWRDILLRSGALIDGAKARMKTLAPALFGLTEEEAGHSLSPELEGALSSLQRTGGHAWQSRRDRLESAMSADVFINGRNERLTVTSIRGLASDPSPDTRKAAWESEHRLCAEYAGDFAEILNAIKGEAHTVSKLRGFGTPLDWMLHMNRMSRPTFDALMGAVREALPVLRRYIRAKARLLGRDALPYYDLFAPVGAEAKVFTPEEAVSYVSGLLSRIDPGMGSFVAKACENGWIDALPRTGKQGGALCAPIPSLGESRVFLNFDGGIASVLTLAHEFGHAWHDKMCANVPPILRDPPTPLCETASTFNETAVYDLALAEAKPEERLFLLDALLSGAAKNIVDMYSRFLFEHEFMQRRVNGPLDKDEISGIMLDSQKSAFGQSLDQNALHKFMWMGKVHYYITNYHYYNFPYSFGLLFSQALYGLCKSDPVGFPKRYGTLLAETCTGTCESAAASVGIDLHDPAFWRRSVDYLAGRVGEFEGLLG